MKTKIFLFVLLCAGFCTALQAQLKVSILGDSYSTYGGYVTPATNLCWYNGTDGGGKEKKNDVKSVEQTWWKLLTTEHACLQLDINNSYSGSTICHTGYRKRDFSDRSFITRVHALGDPDILLIFGGTNDSWAKAPIGEYSYGHQSKKDLYTFRPAFAYLLQELTTLYPEARIINITNSELSDEVTASMAEICEYYKVTNLQLKDIDKQWGHPSIQGMKSISEQVWKTIHDTVPAVKDCCK